MTQAKNAIANGGIFGKGLFRGTSTNLAYVPEQQTDFIFSAVGEQLGFVGAGVLLLLYGVLAWRILRTAQLARDTYGRLICAGVLRPARLLGLRERGHEHGHHAGDRHPASVPVLRRLGHDRLLHRHRARLERPYPKRAVSES